MPSAALNVTLPLLFTNSELYWFPKKLTGNGSATTDDDPSSFAGSSVAVQLASLLIAPAAGSVAMTELIQVRNLATLVQPV